jgi:hypothetical protein
MQQAQLLRRLVLGSRYIVDEELVAGTLARDTTRRLLVEVAFCNDPRGSQAGSLGREEQARTFQALNLRMPGDGGVASIRRGRS